MLLRPNAKDLVHEPLSNRFHATEVEHHLPEAIEPLDEASSLGARDELDAVREELHDRAGSVEDVVGRPGLEDIDERSPEREGKLDSHARAQSRRRGSDRSIVAQVVNDVTWPARSTSARMRSQSGIALNVNVRAET